MVKLPAREPMRFADVLVQSHGNYGGGYGGNGGGYGGGGWGGGGGYEDKMGGLGGGLRTIDWASQKLERFEKNFYVEDKRVSAMADREVEDFRKTKEIKV
jgi:ATP-dependent RNA helicase DDX5/DBP2